MTNEERDFREAVELIGQIPPVHLEIAGIEAWVILSQMQLALRHPGNIGPASKAAYQLARTLQSLIAPQGTALGRLAERGWHEVFDVPRDEAMY